MAVDRMATVRYLADGPLALAASVAIRAAALAARGLVVVGEGALGDLAAELGGLEVALAWLLRLAIERSKPLGVNLPAQDGASTTFFLAPPGWAPERLQGWVAGQHEALEAAYGPVDTFTTSAPAGRRPGRRRRR